MNNIEWHNIEENPNDLPNFYTGVIIYCKDGTNTDANAVEIDGVFQGFKQCATDNYYIKGVTHWHEMYYLDKPK